MKTAISIPDPVYKSAEGLAKKMKLTRSAFYTLAVKSFVDLHKDDKIKILLNNVYGKTSSRLNKDFARAQSASLKREEW